MSRISTLFLRVKEVDEADYGRSVIRINRVDKPTDIYWGNYVSISLDKKNWVTCKLEPASDTDVGKIYIGIHLRGILNKDTVRAEIAKLDVPSTFYIRKASFWEILFRSG